MNILLDNHTLILSIVFLVVAGLMIAVGAMLTGRDRQIATRIQSLSRQSDRNTDQTRPVPGSRKTPAVTDSLLFSNQKQRACLQAQLLEAGIYQPWAPSLYFGIRIVLTLGLPGLCFAGVLLGWVSLQYALLAGGPASVLGICLPYVWLQRRRAKRHLVLRRAIPDFLDLIVACLGGGLSVQAALKQVTGELKLAHPELSGELSVLLREIELGGKLDHALQQLAVRTGVDELKILRTFISQTVKFGTTITDALGQMAEMLRVQREQRAEELAQKAAVKILIPTMLFIFPTVFVILAGPAAIQIQEGLLASTQQESSPVK